jgi:two-component system response regulator PilR (NtrC family)
MDDLSVPLDPLRLSKTFALACQALELAIQERLIVLKQFDRYVMSNLATHKNLAELVAMGSFREDLFYRINVIEMRVPALRERAEDIPELAEHILRRLVRRAGAGEFEITPEAMAMLREYAFPGNVRELENILERALTLSTDGRIRPDDIRLRSVGRAEPTAAAAVPAHAPEPDPLPVARPVTPAGALGDQLEGMEREAIVKALEQTRYNKTAAARLLGVTFRALRYRIKKLGIE